MEKKIKVAVIGATGAVGQVFMWMLSDHPWFELSYVTASAARVGQEYGKTVHWVMPFEMPESIKTMEVREMSIPQMKESGVKIVFSALPAGNTDMFVAGRGQGSLSWTLLYFFTVFFSYNGGTWNLAARYISTPDGKDAKKSAFFSAFLYLFWPLILFFPMWVGPVIFPGMDQKTAESLLYASLTNKFLPTGMIGLVLASMFANTMTMCNSDANTIAAVITRDIVPAIKPEMKNLSEKDELFQARLWTAIFTAATVVIALFNDYFGGVTGLILSWFAALLGPTAIPLIFGLFPCFKYSDGKAAVISTIAGLGVFVLTKCGVQMEADIAVAAPLFVSAVFYVGIGLINKYVLHKTVKPEIEDLMVKLSDKSL